MKTKEFWGGAFTEKSFEVLQRIRGEFKFVLIGGWAVYLYTRALKSKDVDIIVDYATLDTLKQKYALNKNPDLMKYEFQIEDISVDVYVSYFSKLIIPCQDIEKMTREVEGFTVPEPEVLLALKQQAEFVRKGAKAQKDRVDILMLLSCEEVDIKRYAALMKKYELKDYLERLRKIVNDSKDEWGYIGYTNPRDIKKIKTALLSKLVEVKR